jgi:Fe-S-cluster containining protein
MSWLGNQLEAETLARQLRIKLDVIQKEHPRASDQGKTECCHSGHCCWKRPGSLVPADVPALAAFLKLTPKELFRTRLVVDEICGTLMLLPARAHQAKEGLTGSMLGWRETYSAASPCIFLTKDNLCAVHEVKPESCRRYRCWEANDINEEDYRFTPEQLKALGWSGFDPDDYDDDSDY